MAPGCQYVHELLIKSTANTAPLLSLLTGAHNSLLFTAIFFIYANRNEEDAKTR